MDSYLDYQRRLYSFWGGFCEEQTVEKRFLCVVPLKRLNLAKYIEIDGYACWQFVRLGIFAIRTTFGRYDGISRSFA